MQENDCVVALTTLPLEMDAAALGRTLVTERLAACVQAQAPVRSVYRWQGAVESAAEQLLCIKTTAHRIEGLRRRLHDLHPYDVPELVVLPIVDGHPGYLAWLVESTAPGEESGP